MYKLFKIFIFAFCLGVTAVSCSKNGNGSSENVITHPIEENIPYFDREHIEISQSTNYLPGITGSSVLDHLYHFLQNPDQTDKTELEFLVSDAYWVDIEFINEDQILILDRDYDSLFQYHIETGKVDSIAGQGQGPGDLNFSQDLTRDGNHFYVGMEDMRISEFNCNPPVCEYTTTIPLSSSALSIAKTDEKFAVLGHSAFSPTDDFEIGNAISLVNQEGEVLDTFGKYYDAEQWIVYITLRMGKIRYSQAQRKYVFAQNFLPIIYIFDEDLELFKTFILSDFIQGKMVNNLKAGSAGIREGDDGMRSMISDIKIIDDDFALVYTTTFTDARYDESSDKPPFIYHYYVIDLSDSEVYFMGKQSAQYMTKIYPSEYGLVLNDGESVFLTE